MLCDGVNDDAILPTPAGAVELLTVAEVAAMMRVSKMTIYRMIDSEELHAIRVGKSIRLPRTSFDAFLRDAGQPPQHRTDPHE